MLNDHILRVPDPINPHQFLYLGTSGRSLTDNIFEASIKPQIKLQNILNLFSSIKKNTPYLEMFVRRHGKRYREQILWAILNQGQIKQIDITVI